MGSGLDSDEWIYCSLDGMYLSPNVRVTVAVCSRIDVAYRRRTRVNLVLHRPPVF